MGDTIVHLFHNPRSSNIKAWWGIAEEIERDTEGEAIFALTGSRTLYERKFNMENPPAVFTDSNNALVIAYGWHDDHENGHYLLRVI